MLQVAVATLTLALLAPGCSDDEATPSDGQTDRNGDAADVASDLPEGDTVSSDSSDSSDEIVEDVAPYEVGADVAESSTRQTARPLGDVDGAANGYYEYRPPGYQERPPVPLLVFWHGLGENGNGASELARVLANGPPALIARNQWPAERPFLVLSPQHSGSGCPTPTEVHDFLAFALDEYANVDPNRVYLTGLSCGAIGSWNYLGDYLDEVVAAAVLIAGNGSGAWNEAGCQLAGIPIWAFHGEVDNVVPPGGSINVLGDIQACTDPAPVDAQLTVYEGVGHDSWSRTYDLSAGHDIYAWLLSHRK